MIHPARLFLLVPLMAALCHSAAAALQRAPVDSAAAELEAGRPWHAARLLGGAGASGLDGRGRLLLARAEAGARNWQGVRRQLEGAAWLDQQEGGAGWALLARALEETERWSEAAEAYRRYLTLPHATSSGDAPAALARAVRALVQARATDQALAQMQTLRTQQANLAAWTALEVARVAATRGEVQSVRSLMAFVPEGELRMRAWDLEPRALISAGDSAAALAALTTLVGRLEPATRRGEAWVMLGELLRARGPAAEARRAFVEALTAGAPAAPAGRAARHLLDMGDLDAPTALQVARALERVGDTQRALRAYDRHVSLVGAAAAPASVRLARAQLMAQGSTRHDEAVQEFTALSTDSEVGPLALDQWARLRDRQGRAADATTLRNRLIERFPASTQAAEVMFLRGDAAQDQAGFDAAVREYRRLVEAAPAQDRAGLARMRWGQIHLQRAQPAEAAAVFEGYLAAFPTGRRWEEATYWAARARQATGDSARARAHLAELRTREPFGYYAILAGELVGDSFSIDVPEGEEPPFPQWVRAGLRELELLASAGLDDGANATVAELRARARQAPPAEGLRLSMELTRLGRSLDGINLASELRTRGEPWTRRLLRAVYPFPEPQRIYREARERGADPLLVAALIRQESAWEEDIRSPVGATGLMQVMPATGAELFRQQRLGDFNPEMLEVGDLNLHLGTGYLVELLARYQGDLPLALSGYNAGPHRADRWKSFPEAADPLRFTERIPFAETRSYVKLIYRNRAIYRALYGPGSAEH